MPFGPFGPAANRQEKGIAAGKTEDQRYAANQQDASFYLRVHVVPPVTKPCGKYSQLPFSPA
jgi:hypothetical protein